MASILPKHPLTRCTLLLSALGPSLLTATDLSPVGESVFGAPVLQGWSHSPWYGWVEVSQYPWVQSWPHGWQYVTAQEGGSVWVYDYALGSWMWTSSSTFPWIYKAGGHAGWMRFIIGTQTPARTYWHASLQYVAEGADWGPEVVEGMVRIPAAGMSFTLGSPADEPGRLADEGPQQSVSFTRDFCLAQLEVTYGQWAAVRDAAAGTYPDLGYGRNGNLGDDSLTHPVTEVTWWDVIKWCNAKSELEGLTPVYTTDASWTTVLRTGSGAVHMNPAADGYRLPTEAEWEYACRAGTTDAFYNGPITHTETADPNLDVIGWYWDNSNVAIYPNINGRNNTQPVGRKQANTWHLYDMSGNVSEWCWNWYGSQYGHNAVTDPTGPVWGSSRVVRGGDFYSAAAYCRSADRDFFDPTYRSIFTGFRLARTPRR